jgi:two-component system chemotaxis sensor kinase CheA
MFGCRDDGRGVDLDAIRRVAHARNLFDPGAPDPEDQALLSLLLKGGISTSGSVTDVSGRGVGLDVVRESVERLGGEVSLRTERGIGTTIELVIPSSLTALQALSVGIAEADGGAGTAYIPLAAVRRSLRITPDQISRGAKGDAIIFEQQAVPFVPLGTLLGDAPGAHSTAGAAVVLSGSQGLAAVGIDRLLGTAGIVVRPLPDTLQASPIVGGTTLDAGGNPRLVLDADGLVAAALEGVPAAPAPAPTARPVLVVDDSLTTRMLEQSILESAGYEVDLAISAEEALEILRRKRYALILVDVEMPGMDGFTFIERLRADPSLRDTPAILVTSRASPEDLARGRAAGANGHIVKSEFDQTEFMTMIKAMVV